MVSSADDEGLQQVSEVGERCWVEGGELVWVEPEQTGSQSGVDDVSLPLGVDTPATRLAPRGDPPDPNPHLR